METYRLKNIIILILLLVNLSLLLLVLSNRFTREQATQNLIAQTTVLLETNGIEIDPDLLQESAVSTVYAYHRDEAAEAAFVAALLGDEAARSDSGGGAYHYTAEAGSASFRSNGSFTLEATEQVAVVEDIEKYVKEICPSNYALTSVTTDGARCTVTAMPYLDALPVYSASIRFVFEEQRLLSAEGFLVPAAADSAETADIITSASASIYLMDDCNETGRICNTITDISTGYLLQSTASTPILLTPVYHITTNTYSYYVDAVTGHVSVIR
jgi:regulatory protein YycI of two-component signal transduction system YycFG